jgi:hypothetical protein
MTRYTLVAVTLTVAIWSALTACSTYKTLDPRQDKLTSSGKPRGVDETDGQYGQPYYLPKGLIHLVIKPEGGSSPSNTPPSTASSANNNSQVVTVNTAAPQQQQNQQPNPDDGTQPVAYKITVDRVIVPDFTTGPYLARYEQNWLYAENVSLGVTDDGLLTTVSTTASDRTAQILSNLEDTAINVAKFAVQGGLLASRFPEKGEVRPVIPRVRYKRLNVDVTFDPLDPNSVAGVKEIFKDEVITNLVEGNTTLVSPFDFELTTAYSAGNPLRPKQPGVTGLWFRETTPVQLVLRQRTSAFPAAVQKSLRAVRAAVASYQQAVTAAKADNDIAANNSKASAAAQSAAQSAVAVTGQKTEDQKTRDLADLDAAKKTAAEDSVKASNAATKLNTLNDTLTAAKAVLTNLNATAAAPTISRSATFIKAVPNPDRVFSFNISRSAFVQNKKIDLTITNGLLTKVTLNKPSEVEGFSEIPLDLSKKLLELPKDLLTIRTQTTSSAAAKNTVNAETKQAATESPAQSQAVTDQLKAEAARLEAETKLIQDQRALQGAINNQ